MQDLPRKSLRTSWALVTTVALSFLLLLAAAVLVFRISRAADEADQWVEHTLEVKQSIVRLLNSLTSAEAGQRGYLITGNSAFLEPYETAKLAVPLQLRELRERVADNPQQVGRLDKLQPLVAERVGIIDETLVLARRNQLKDAARIVEMRGAPLMAQVRERLDELDATESRLLMERRQNVAAIRDRFIFAVTIMLFACGLLALFALLSVRRYLLTANESSRRLAAYNADLELRVNVRTEELAAAAEVATRERNRAEALLTDVNHRVGNNLALVSSFLAMQQRAARSPEAARALNAARARVQAIASAHRKLRLGADFATVKANEVLGAVLEDICAGLPPGDLIRVSYQVAPLEILARDAVSLGVLTSELVMNAVKHAFSAGESGEVSVRFSNDGATAPFLEVIDDGMGWNEKQTNESDGLGARIIDMVARQFGGEPERSVHRQGNTRPGTKVRVDLTRLQCMQAS